MSGEAILAEVTAQGVKIRDLKTGGADKAALMPEITKLLALKAQYKEVTGEDVPGPPKKEKKKKGKAKAAPAPKKEAPKAKAKVAPAPAPAAAAAPAPVKAPAPPAKLPGLRPEENAGTMYEMGSMYGSQAAFTENAGTMYAMNPVGMVKLAGVVASAPAATPASTGGAAEALRDRQLALIATLEASLAKVDAEVSKLGGTPGAAAGGGSAAGKMAKHGQVRPDNTLANNLSAGNEVSISAHPAASSMILNSIINSLTAAGTVIDLREYWHSSMGDSELRPTEAYLQSHRLRPRIQCDLRINWLWKNVESPVIVHTPSQHVPISGEVNIAKFLCRIASPSLYPEDFVAATTIDQHIDTASKLYGANSKAMKAALKPTNVALGQSDFLCGDAPNLADIVLYCSSVDNEPGEKNVKKWMKRMEVHPLGGGLKPIGGPAYEATEDEGGPASPMSPSPSKGSRSRVRRTSTVAADVALPDNDASAGTLREMKVAYDLFGHPVSATVDEWRPHCELHAPNAKICKNLFLKDKKKTKLILVTALSETNTDLKVLEKLLSVKNLRLTEPDVLMEKLGLQKGAVTPLAACVDKEREITFVLDKAMLDAGKKHNLLVHPTSGNTYTVVISGENLLAYFKHCGVVPIVVEFPPKKE